jgi:hypothetical protein
MNPGAGIFLYLPVPYWAAFVLLLYRHDLSRLFHPFRDDRSERSWWLVLNHLGLLDAAQAAQRPGRIREVLPYFVLLAISIAVSLSWTFRVYPSFYYYLIIVQGISAIILTAATVQYLGTPPRRPYVDVLRYPRLGSRVRHLPRVLPMKPADDKKLPKSEEKKTFRMTTAKRYITAPFRRIKRRLRR